MFVPAEFDVAIISISNSTAITNLSDDHFAHYLILSQQLMFVEDSMPSAQQLTLRPYTHRQIYSGYHDNRLAGAVSHIYMPSSTYHLLFLTMLMFSYKQSSAALDL